MKTLDRRGLLRGILFGAAAAGVAFAPIAATAMPLDDTQLPGALDGWIEKTQVWVAPARVVAPGAASTAAGETRSPCLQLALGLIQSRL
jgi:hypothetical protein